MSKAKAKALKRKSGNAESKMFDALDKSLGRGKFLTAEGNRVTPRK